MGIDDTLKSLEKKETDRKNLKEQQEERKRKQREEKDKVRKALEICGKDANVQIVLRYMAKISGQFQSLIVIKADGDVAPNSMLVNNGRRSLYLDVRRLMSDDLRKTIEGKGEETDHVEND